MNSTEPPKGLGISARVRWRMEHDSTTIRDAENFRVKWGEYPEGMSRKKSKRSKKEWLSGKEFNPAVKVGKSVAVKHPDRVMIATNEFHTGKAVWFFEVGAWACKSADVCLSFLLKKSVKEAQLELTRRGFSYKWEDK